MADVGAGLFHAVQQPGMAVLDRPNFDVGDTVAKQSGSSLVTSKPNAHKNLHNAWHQTLLEMGHSSTESVPCAGWLSERCSHNNY